jgi:uncharacterized protein YukE
MANDSTTVQYNIVRDGVNKIEDSANKMESIFNDYDQSMKISLDPSVFAGIAADAVSTDYATFKSQFNDFIALVRQFAQEYRTAANIMESHEKSLESKSQSINKDLVRM